jgi:hypothetical protein
VSDDGRSSGPPSATLEHKLGRVIQYAYVVPDLDLAMLHYTEILRVGPWFKRGPFTPGKALYRGRPAAAELSLARAFCGDSMIEIIQQHDRAPSVFREVIELRGYGFHHWAIPTRTFEAETLRFQRQGFEVAYSDVLESGARIHYMDTLEMLGGLTELVEMNDAQLERYTHYYRSSIRWDGSEPVRAG